MRHQILRGIIVAALAATAVGYGALEKHVVVRVEGRGVAVRTFAGTVASALTRAGVAVGPHDRVEPARDAPLRDGLEIEVLRAKEITLVLDGKPRRIMVTGLTIEEVLEEVNIRGSLVDSVKPSRATRVRDGMTITYRRALNVRVRHDGKTQQVITNATTVGQLISELGLRLGPRDRVEPSVETRPAAGMTIRILRVGLRREVSEVVVPFKTILRRDRTLEYGRREVRQEGRRGLTRHVYEAKYVDGERVSRRLIRTIVVRAPQSRIIAVGASYPGCVCDRGVQTGGASWYRQADGLTAAHRTLPFGTVVRVENLSNGKWVNVVIRDRGPYISGRVIDLSDEAFARLAPLSTGVIKVRIRW